MEHEPPLEQGGTYLVTRCLQWYDDWDVSFARRVLKAYRTFLQLAANTKDWRCRSLVAPQYVESMWRVHRADVVSYCHDCMLLMGHVLGSNLDDDTDSGYQQRQEITLQKLKDHIGSNKYDKEIWYFHGEEQDDDASNRDDEVYHDSTEGHYANDHQDNSMYADSVMTIAICYQGNINTTTYFKVRSDTCMAKVFENIPFCKYGVRREDEIEYYLSYRADETCHDNRQRTPIQPTQTAAELQLIDGDQINLTLVSNLTHDDETSEKDYDEAKTLYGKATAAGPDDVISSEDINEEDILQINQEEPELNRNQTVDDGEAVAEEKDNDADSERSFAAESDEDESTDGAEKDNVTFTKSYEGDKIGEQPSPSNGSEMETVAEEERNVLSTHCYAELSDDVDDNAKGKIANYKHSFDRNALKYAKERALVAARNVFKKKEKKINDNDESDIDDGDKNTTSNGGDCKSIITTEKGTKKNSDNKSEYCYTVLSDDDMATVKHKNPSPRNEIVGMQRSNSDGFYSCDGQENTPTRPIKKRRHRDMIKDAKVINLFNEDGDDVPRVQPIRARKDVEASREESMKKNDDCEEINILSDSEDRATRMNTPKKKRSQKSKQEPQAQVCKKRKRLKKHKKPDSRSDGEEEAQTQVIKKNRSVRSKRKTTPRKETKKVSKEVQGLELWRHHSQNSKGEDSEDDDILGGPNESFLSSDEDGDEE